MGLFLVYPFAAILRATPNKQLKHLLSLLGGVFLVQWVFGPDWIHSFVTSLGTYVMCLILPGKIQASAVFYFVMSYMVLSHMNRMYVSYLSGIFDYTGTQMVLTMKLTSFAYNYFDGNADRKRVFPEKPYEDKRKARVYADRAKFAITSLPSLLEFFGYIYCFTCILAGPAFEYNDYIRSIDGDAFAKSNGEGDDKIKTSKPPSSFFPALKTLVVGVVCLAGHLVTSGKYPLKKVYDATFISTNDHTQRYIFTWIALFGERLKYYFAWFVLSMILLQHRMNNIYLCVGKLLKVHLLWLDLVSRDTIRMDLSKDGVLWRILV